MTDVVITEDVKGALQSFLSETAAPELVNAYLCYVEKKHGIQPVLFPKDKVIYKDMNALIDRLSEAGKLWHETEIKIGFEAPSVDENTKRIYICPFTGKVFGDNTHPNPQDAIYDWVSKCPENTERQGGLPVKRFFVSEDPEIIANYAEKNQPEEPVTKVVFSSAVTGKLFNSKEAVIEDFKINHLKPMTLVEVQNQNRFKIEDDLLTFIQDQLEEEKVGVFIQALAEHEEFIPYVQKWLG